MHGFLEIHAHVLNTDLIILHKFLTEMLTYKTRNYFLIFLEFLKKMITGKFSQLLSLLT